MIHANRSFKSCTIKIQPSLATQKLMVTHLFELPSPPQKMLRAWPMAIALAATLSGCATSTPQNPSTAAQSSVAPADSLALWWQRFNDPLLSTLVTQALQANTSIRSAQAALQQSRALRDVKSAALLPGLTASGSAGRSKLGDLDASNSFKAGLDASWEPDIFGGNRSALNATEADAKAFEASLGDVQVSVAAEVALAYIQLRGLQTQLGIARTNLASQQETLQITDWRAQAGLITSLEVEQARTAAEQTSAQIPALETSIAKTRSALSVLTGQRPDALNTLLAESQPVPQAAISLVQSIPAQTLRQRPDVRAAEHRISAALARVSVAQAARYPGFSISGSLGLNALTLGALTNGASVVNSLLGGVSVPLFDGGAAKSQVLAQEAALEQARASYQAVMLTALKDVEDALVALKGDRTRQIHLQGAATAAGNADLLAQQRFKSGLIDFQTVLQTQRTLLTAQDSVASASADISADHVRLYKALGGGWN
jgi:multidrug efflux system outer membrane protein